MSTNNTKRERGQVNNGTTTTKLMSRIEQAMKGFHGLNAIAYKHKNEYVTYSRPGDCLKVSPENIDQAEFIPDRKEIWPVLNNMQTNLPLTTIKRRPNRVNHVEYIVPQSDKQPIIPKPILPQSKGLKLRPIDEIINDGKLLGASSKKSNGSAGSITRANVSTKSSTPTTTTTKPTSKIQGVLDIITSGGSHGNNNNTNGSKSAPYTNNTKLMKSATSTSNRPRKSSLLKSEITSSSTPTIKVEDTQPHHQQRLGSKKPMSSLTNTTTNRPRHSSKSTSSQKNNSKYNQDVPVSNYLKREEVLDLTGR